MSAPILYSPAGVPLRRRIGFDSSLVAEPLNRDVDVILVEARGVELPPFEEEEED